MREIVVVTAFFNINRKDWTGFKRSSELYFGYFKGWASIKNRLVAYVESEDLKEKIIEFRSSVGLADRTIVNVIPNILEVDKELLISIESTVNPVQQRFRVCPSNPESWNAKYNYIMLMKQWCAADAVKRGQIAPEEMLAWVDFGFNHGGKSYSLDSNFNFQWKFDFQDKINLFSTQPLDERPIFDVVLSMDTYIMAMVLVGTAKYWETFRRLVRESMMELNKSGLMDDDQNIILMAVRKCPELFYVKVSSWDTVLFDCGCKHLIPTVIYSNKLSSCLHHIANRIKYRITLFRYVRSIYSYYKNRVIH